MPDSQSHRKPVKYYHEPGDLYELTFSCYRRMPLLSNDRWRKWLAESLGEAAEAYAFDLIAFVLMPEHVHWLVRQIRQETAADDISLFLAAGKRPVSQNVKAPGAPVWRKR